MPGQYQLFSDTVTKIIMCDFKGQISSLEVAAFHMKSKSGILFSENYSQKALVTAWLLPGLRKNLQPIY